MATYAKVAQYYDLVYSFKNYQEEVIKIQEVISGEHPSARCILDVACGTAEHAKLLSNSYEIDGIDLEHDLINIARLKVPSGKFEVADMRDFSLDRRYDVVQCLFSSIGYLIRGDDVVAALTRFREHLKPGGIIIVEPWYTPETYQAGALHMVPPINRDEIKLCRMNISDKEGNLSRIKFHYLVARKEGVEHFEDDHQMMLYTVDEMLGFFRAAELKVQYDPFGLTGRGLYVAKKA